jgi:hypothetical protein
MLYLKEMGEDWYSKVCAVCVDVRLLSIPLLTSHYQAYFSAASGLHSQEMKDLFVAYASLVKKATEEEMEMGECGCGVWKLVIIRTPSLRFQSRSSFHAPRI